MRSVDGSDVIALFDTAYAPPASLDLASRAAGAQGFAPLRTGADGDGLDYLREDGLVDLDAMVTSRFPLEKTAEALDSDRIPGSVKAVVAI